MTFSPKSVIKTRTRRSERRTADAAMSASLLRLDRDDWSAAPVYLHDEPTAGMRTVLVQTSAGWNSLRHAC